MFLTGLLILSDIVSFFLCFIEEHSVLISIITSVIVSSLWFRKYINQKRAEAFFGFYSKLSLCIKSLQTMLEENGQLNISDPELGNIYTLIYTKNFIKDVCPKYKIPEKEELELYKDSAQKLKNILFNTETNVYPKGTKRKEWYANQQTLFLFCEFIDNDTFQYVTNEKYAKGEEIPKHITKCKLLIDAFNNIQEAISKAKY